MGRTVRVAILFDSPLFGRGLESLLRDADGLALVAVLPRGRGALEELPPLRPDVLLVEQPSDGTDPGLGEILHYAPPGGVLALALDETKATMYLAETVKAGNLGELRHAILSHVRDHQGLPHSPEPETAAANPAAESFRRLQSDSPEEETQA